jgi:hypothetical protein
LVPTADDDLGRISRPFFAVADVMELRETHVFGDVEFRSGPVATAPSITDRIGSFKR